MLSLSRTHHRLSTKSGEPQDLLERAKFLAPEDLQKLCSELLQLAVRPSAARQNGTGWNAEEHRQWLKQTWRNRAFSRSEVEEMRDAEDGTQG